MRMSSKVISPYPIFNDVDGDPLDAGYMYIGETGKNPEVYPVPVFFDENLSIPAPQPIRTRNGYISQSGKPAKLYIANEKCSVTIKNKRKTIIWTDLNADLGLTANWIINKFSQIDMELLFPNFNVVSPETLKVYVQRLPIQAIFKMDGSDETATLKGYIAAAKSLGKPLRLPKGIIIFSDTITLDYTAEIYGAGRDSTILQFANLSPNKPSLSFRRGATKGYYANFSLRDSTFGTSSGPMFSDSRNEAGAPVWKNTFFNVEITAFNIGHAYTSENPLDGANHAHCSENLWLQCRFVNNKTTGLLQNCQAVNNTYLRCDFENFDTSYLNGQTITDSNFDFFRDEAGAGVLVESSSFIGRGRWYSWKYPTGGSGLFAGSAYFKLHDVKSELRTPHYGVLIEELVHGVTGTLGMAVDVSDTTTVNYGASIDLIRYGGRLNGVFNNVATSLGTGKLVVRNYPTLGRSSGATTGSQSTLKFENCGNVEYERETTSPYGTYNRNATPLVIFRDQKSSSTNGSYSIDSDGWMKLNYGGDVQQLSQTFGSMSQYGRLVYNLDWVSSGIGANAQLKIVMPKYGRPLKLFAYKHTQRLTNDVTFNLYLVKDKANWASAIFDKSTDAISAGTIGSTLNKAGYFDTVVNITSSILGTELTSGFGSWVEGRMLIEYVGAVAYAGFVGVEYV